MISSFPSVAQVSCSISRITELGAGGEILSGAPETQSARAVLREAVPIRAGAVTGLLNDCVTRRQDWFELSAPHHGSSLALNLPESEAVPLPPLSFCWSVSAEGSGGFLTKRTADKH
ncbi:hypothetical protein OJAV_G00108060 [Oryzias javanicus]|uniref:Uncharacterized protein n=1 Tax=Oryzias javanicus TaxID=123683 RepID=A0A3S2UAC4_ORYJA|nr:hypothetical protein OJAV_G00108060 [Oryzias javanicus]